MAINEIHKYPTPSELQRWVRPQTSFDNVHKLDFDPQIVTRDITFELTHKRLISYNNDGCLEFFTDPLGIRKDKREKKQTEDTINTTFKGLSTAITITEEQLTKRSKEVQKKSSLLNLNEQSKKVLDKFGWYCVKEIVDMGNESQLIILGGYILDNHRRYDTKRSLVISTKDGQLRWVDINNEHLRYVYEDAANTKDLSRIISANENPNEVVHFKSLLDQAININSHKPRVYSFNYNYRSSSLSSKPVDLDDEEQLVDLKQLLQTSQRVAMLLAYDTALQKIRKEELGL